MATFKKNLVWKDGHTLWSNVVTKSPRKARAYNNLGDALMRIGRYDDAIGVLRLAIEFEPMYVDPLLNLGISYIKKDRFDEAISELEKLLRINRVLKGGHYGALLITNYEWYDFRAHSTLGNIYSEKGMLEAAVSHYTEALKLAPADTATRFNLAVTYKRMGMIDEARAEFEEVLKIDPSDREARSNLKMLGGK
jgi:tetratricopeptide (TPR) repeat protein